jgi:hypothetical protein
MWPTIWHTTPPQLQQEIMWPTTWHNTTATTDHVTHNMTHHNCNNRSCDPQYDTPHRHICNITSLLFTACLPLSLNCLIICRKP